MRVILATVAGLVIWALSLTFLPMLLSYWWDMQPDALASVFALSWGASLVGLLIAREAAQALSAHDHHPHAFTLTGAALVLVASILGSQFDLPVTLSALGAMLACIVDWRMLGASYNRGKRQRKGA